MTGDAATLRAAARDWLALDFDSVAAPSGLDFAAHPARGFEHLRALLPAEFRGVKAVWRCSSSAGVKPGLRGHLWVRLSCAITNEQAAHWLRDAPVDRSLFRTVQPHFTADPIFVDGMGDPMSARIGLLDGAEVVEVPQEIIDWAPAALVPASSAPGLDPQVRAALRKWSEQNAPRLAGYIPGSERYACVCGSSDGLAVREDGRWNCHGAKHGGCDIGEEAASGVFVFHPVEALERIPRGELRAWLKERYPECFTFGSALTERRRAAAAAASREAPVHIVNSAPVDALDASGDGKPTVRELDKANAELKRAVKVVNGNPERLDDVAAAMGRFVPLFLAQEQVSEALLAAALASVTAVVHRPDAERRISEALAVGMAQPIVPARLRQVHPLAYDEHGRPQKCYANVLALVGEEIVAGCLAWNERREAAFVLQSPPWYPDDARTYPRAVDDTDYSLLAAYLSGVFDYPHATPAAVAEAVNAVAHDRRWDPVCVYLDGLDWNDSLDEARELLESAPVPIFGTDDTPYCRAVLKRWMIAAVQRAYEPGCVQREVLTLIGPQNVGKSRALAALCPDPQWFTETCDADGSKDSREALLGIWIVELSEVDKHIREDRSGAFKSFISARDDKFRRAYARTSSEHPRRCIFAATTNETKLFVDQSGNTRFNVLRVTRGDYGFISEHRDELWAAAVALYRAGEPSWLQPGEVEAARAAQEEHRAENTAAILVRELLDTRFTVGARGQILLHGQKQTAQTAWDANPLEKQLGFAPDVEQLEPVDGEGRTLALLKSTQIAAYLRANGLPAERATHPAVRATLERAGWVQGRVRRNLDLPDGSKRELGSWATRRLTWGVPSYIAP